MNFILKKKHLPPWVGCIFFFTLTLEATKNNAKRSVLIKGENVRLLEKMKDGSVKDWGKIRPGQTFDVPNGSSLKFRNETKKGAMTLIEKKSPDLPIKIDYQESVTTVESETGDLGFEKETADGKKKLITSIKHYNKMHSSEESAEAIPNTEQANSNKAKDTPIFTRTITKLPSKNDDPYDFSDDSLDDLPTQTPTLSENSNWSAYLFGGGFVALGILGYYYLITNISQCNRLLAREDTWSSWKCEEPYEVLLQIEPQYLVDDLIRDINTTYYQEDNPVELFLEDVAEEYDTLCKWIQFRITVDRLWIPLGPDFYTMEHRLHLLNLMRKTVYYWRAQQLST